MGRSLKSPKEIVRIRSGNLCEKCGVKLDVNSNGVPKSIRSRSMHHRHPKRYGGKDSVLCMVNICIGCHREIHADEEKAARGGWIVLTDDVGRVPFDGWQGSVLPDRAGGLTLLNWDTGRAEPLREPVLPGRRQQSQRPRRRYATRAQYDRRRRYRGAARAA